MVLACESVAGLPGSVAYAQTTNGPNAPNPGASKESARKLFDQGLEAERAGQFAFALEKYAQAEKVATPTAGLRFHKAYCLEMTGQMALALSEYNAAATLAIAANKPDVHAAIAARRDPLRLRVPQLALRLTTPPPGTSVELDKKPVSAELLDGRSFRVDPGEHKLEAHAPDRTHFERTIMATEGSSTTVEITLPLEKPALPVAKEKEKPHSRSYAWPIVTTTGAVLFAGGGVASLLLAGNAQSDAKSMCAKQVTSPCTGDRTKIRTLDALALGGFIGAAGLGALSIVLFSSGGGSPEKTDKALSTPVHARLVASPTALSIEGAF
ncbi:MAG: hypothetical protein FWD73_07415 [Polyangiaceae bacterium]|nr:hypothetical protein [Polyangiaceae bacterium]